MPIAVVGARRPTPIFAHVRLLQRLTGLIYFPITPTFPALGALAALTYLPAKFTISFLEPVRTDDLGDGAHGDEALVQTISDDIRDRIQAELVDMLGERRSVWLG